MAKKEYTYAIKLAKRYNLSEDLVYQEQWCTNPVTQVSPIEPSV